MAISLGRLEIETSDHTTLRYDLAGVGNRGFAALADFIVATILTVGVFFAVEAALGGAFAATGVAAMLGLVLGWSYFILLEWLWNGQTLGKRMTGLRVITIDGSPPRAGAVVVRNLVRVIDFLPGFYGFGLVAIVVSGRSQRLGDLAAGTFVVRAPRARLDWTALRTVARGDASARTQVRGLSGEAQRLVREFVAREGTLRETERRALAHAIAGHLRGRVDGVVAEDDVELVRAVARSLRAAGDR